MIVWRILGNEIGPDGNGAAYFATKQEAEKAKREAQDNGCECYQGPEKIIVKNRADLAWALNDAMGYGAT